jgi:signal peptidase I
MAATPGTGTTAGDTTPRWGRVLRVAAARGLLAIVASLLLWGLVPVVLGWQPQLILTGSMEPRIMPGDLVVTRPVDPTTLKLGQVVTVDDPDHDDGRTRTHRIVRIDEHGDLVLRGDNNPMDDSSPVPLDAVHGVGVLRVPYVGRPLLWLGQHQYVPLGLTLLVLAWAVGTVLGGPGTRDDDRDEHDDEGGSTGRPGMPAQRLDESGDTPRLAGQRRRRAGAGIASTVVAVLVAGSGPAQAAFTEEVANPVSSFVAASTFGSAYVDAVLGDSPYLYWRLDEKSGFSVADSSGNGRGGTIMNSTTFDQAGALSGDSNGAVRLSNEWITQNGSAVTAPSRFSLEAWIKTTGTTGGRILGFGNRNGSSASPSIDRSLYLGNNGRVYFALASGKTSGLDSGTALNDGHWHHVVATYTNSGAGGMRLYVDGSLADTGKGSLTSMTGWWRAGGDSMSGYTANPYDSFYDGTIDEVAVYDSVLTADEVADHFAQAG